MPANVHKVDFYTSRDRSSGSTRLHLARSKVVSLTHETPILSLHHNIEALPSVQRQEAMIAALLALALHLAGLILNPVGLQQDPVMPPAMIQVSWIAGPQSKSKNTPVASPKRQQPAAKPKPKPKSVKRVKTRPKTLLSTTAKSATITTAPSENTTMTAKSAATQPAEAPASKTRANASQTAAAPAPNSQQTLTMPNLNADYLDNPAPRYPEEARERGDQGKVLVRALINADGTVAELGLKKSSGHPSLDQSALKTVKNWRFVPAQRGNLAVSAWVVVPILFSLEG